MYTSSPTLERMVAPYSVLMASGVDDCRSRLTFCLSYKKLDDLKGHVHNINTSTKDFAKIVLAPHEVAEASKCKKRWLGKEYKYEFYSDLAAILPLNPVS